MVKVMNTTIISQQTVGTTQQENVVIVADTVRGSRSSMKMIRNDGLPPMHCCSVLPKF